MKKRTTDEFIGLAVGVHGEKFGYARCHYVNQKSKVEILCHSHGYFLTNPDTHLKGAFGGCSQCARSSSIAAMMKARDDAELRSDNVLDYVTYNQDTGIFSWKGRASLSVPIGGVVGSKTKSGYVEARIGGRRYLLHRLAWFVVHGEWPNGEIDHINGIRDDNRIDNLRVATFCNNQQNKGVRVDNTSGVKGVCWDKWSKSWKARVSSNGVLVYEGRFKNIDDANAAVERARIEHHGKFARKDW